MGIINAHSLKIKYTDVHGAGRLSWWSLLVDPSPLWHMHVFIVAPYCITTMIEPKVRMILHQTIHGVLVK